MSARDKINDIIDAEVYYAPDGEIEGLGGLADAILAAMPDMIALLVWECRSNVSCTAHTPFGEYLVETCHEDGYGMWTPRDDTEDDPPFGYHEDMQKAITAANAHHRAAIMAAFNGEAKP
jgi:hypothetical protein